MAKEFSTTWTAQLPGGDDVEVAVTYEATPYIPASGPNSYGPGDPPEGGDIELLEVKRTDTGIIIELPESEKERLLNHLYESHEDDDFDEPPEWDD